MSSLDQALDTVEDEVVFLTTTHGPTDEPFPSYPISVNGLTGVRGTWNFNVCPDMTATTLKHLVHKKVGIPVGQQLLLVGGRQLLGNAPLVDFGVAAGSVVDLLRRAVGGNDFIRYDYATRRDADRKHARNIGAVALWNWDGSIPNGPPEGLALRKGQKIRIVLTKQGSAWCAGIHENSTRREFKYFPLSYVKIPSISQSSNVRSSRRFPWSGHRRPPLPRFDWDEHNSMPWTITERFVDRSRIRVGVSLVSDNLVSVILSLIPEPKARFSSAILKVELTGCVILSIESNMASDAGEATSSKVVGDGVGSSLAYWVITEDSNRRNGLDSQFKFSISPSARPRFAECSVEATVVAGNMAEPCWYNSKRHKCGPNKVML